MVRRSSLWCLAAICACASPKARPGDGGGDAGGFDGGSDGGVTDGGELRILFIGDSYIYVNDLPGMLSTIADTSGGVGPAIRVEQVVQGGAELSDLWASGIAQPAIADGGWTHVVLQGESVEPVALFCGGLFQVYARQFGELVEDAGAVPTWFVTWARAAGDSIYPGTIDTPAEMQDEVTAGYDVAASNFSNSLLACVGPAFQLAIAEHPEIALQQADLSHPTVAGTYLAACTFYVALTGEPVPETSAVPAGLSATDAATLRAIATIGSNCADVHVKGIARLVDSQGGADGTTPDGGAFNFGTTALPIASTFYLLNAGETAIQLSDATVPPSFEWTSGAYPGGSGGATGNFAADCIPIPPDVPYCGSVLEPQQSCAMSVTYSGASTSDGTLSVDLSGAYAETVARRLSGVATDRAFLFVSNSPDFLPCGPVATCSAGASQVFTDGGSPVPFTVFLGNRGAVAATTLSGEPAASPFAWGGTGFPGGSGAVEMDAGTFDYCVAPLAPGDFCVMTGQFLPIDAGTFLGVLRISYSDSQGPDPEPADWPVVGETPFDSGIHLP
jgi:hypothetical protein